MDEQTAKEVEDLHNNLKDLLHRKRKREESALEADNERLKAENERLKEENTHFKDELKHTKSENRSLKDTNKDFSNKIENLRLSQVTYTQVCSQANLDLSKLKSDNRIVTERLRMDALEQGKRIKVLEAQAKSLRVENKRLEESQKRLLKYEAASKQAVSDLKEKRRLEMEAELELFVSH